MSEQQQQQQQTPLALPAPLDVETTKLELNQTLRLDRLGPMIINSDGTVSRISNWAEMSEIERERTTRMLVKRNKCVASPNHHHHHHQILRARIGSFFQGCDLPLCRTQFQPQPMRTNKGHRRQQNPRTRHQRLSCRRTIGSYFHIFRPFPSLIAQRISGLRPPGSIGSSV